MTGHRTRWLQRRSQWSPNAERRRWSLQAVVLAVLCASLPAAMGAAAPEPLPDYDVIVEIENATPEAKTNWPVIMTVYKVFGRNLPAGTLNPKGYHVYDEKGREIPHMIEAIPPQERTPGATHRGWSLDQQGNNEIVFVVPAIDKGATLRYRVTNTSRASARQTKIDVVGSPHNLISNPGFEARGKGGVPAGWEFQGGLRQARERPGDLGQLDTRVKRSGRSSVRLRGTRPRRLRHAKKIPLHRGSRYYFGIWGKTHEVSRHGIHTSKGGYFTLTGFYSGWRGCFSDWRGAQLTDWDGNVVKKDLDARTRNKLKRNFAASRAAWIFPQCYTRDWFKALPLVRNFTEWGLPEMCMTAAAETAELTIALDQRRQFVRPANQPGTWWLDDAVLMEQPKVTVRFDKLLAPHIKDGLFVFTRPTNMHLGFCLNRSNNYCAMPYPRERADRLDRFAVKGQRVVFLLGVYHTKPLGKVQVAVQGGALASAGGARLPLTEVEYLPGFLGSRRSHLLRAHTEPVDLTDKQGMPYFVINFVVPRDAKAGTYRGQVQLLADGKPLRSIPTTLRVQDMALPILRDIPVGPILQSDPLNDETMRVCDKTGFTGINVGGGIFKFTTGPDGKKHVDVVALGKKIEWLKSHGVTAAVTLWSDADLGPQWGGGKLIKAVKHNKEDFLAEVKRVEDYCQKHPQWPRLIWMTWDEPQPNGSFGPRGHGKPCPKMGWVTEVVPNALTTIDAGFWVWDKILPYYTLPNLDEPADFVGPEVYEYTKKQGKAFGFAGSKNDLDERVRYQVGMMLIASGATNFQYWHLTVRGMLAKRVKGKLLRSISMVATGEGMDDLKIHRILQDAMKEATSSGDATRIAAARKARAYLKRIHSVWDADHTHDESLPYLGLAADWGYDQFYQDWQEQMARYAAACKGVKWIDTERRE